jgi:hypothetical protein
MKFVLLTESPKIFITTVTLIITIVIDSTSSSVPSRALLIPHLLKVFTVFHISQTPMNSSPFPNL